MGASPPEDSATATPAPNRAVGPAVSLGAALRFWAVGLGALAVAAMVYAGAEVLLLVFTAALFGTTLRGAAEWLALRLHVSVRWPLVGCVIVLVVAAAGAVLWIVPAAAAQAADLWARLEGAAAQVRDQLAAQPVPRRLLDGSFDGAAALRRHAGAAAGVVTGMVGLLGAGLFVGFVALYLAASPEPYRRGIVALVPAAHRAPAADVLDALATTLRRWLLARAISMASVGVATGLGLWGLGIPLPVSLAVLAGLFGFVPNVGPLVAAVPALLLAATVSPMHAVYVAILYVAINVADGYLLTPALDRRAVDAPPALTLTCQLLFGALWGLLGVMVATPLVACVLVGARVLRAGTADR